MPRKSHPVVNTNSTPLKLSSSHISQSCEYVQDMSKKVMKQEIRGAIFEYNKDKFLKMWFPKMQHQSCKAVDALREQNVSPQNLGYQLHPFNSSKPFQPWPTSALELDHQRPFMWLLDSILHLSRQELYEPLLLDLRFHLYGREVKEGVDGSCPLKPDGVGVEGTIGEKDKVSWTSIEYAVEVKNDWVDLVAQAATYARCMFSARETRQFALVIGFNHQTFDSRFCFFRRDGLWASLKLNLHDDDGFETFVRAVAGLLSWEALSDAGMDPYRSERHFFIAHQRLDIVHVFCNRRCVRGRATRVYKIRMTLSIPPSETPKEANSGTHFHAGEHPMHSYNL